MSHEAEVLSRMVQVGSVRKYEHILRPEFFNPLHREMFTALCTFEKQYGVCMDEPTFRMQFADFEWTPSNTQIEWLADELKQTYVEEQLRKMWDDVEPTIADNPVVAARAVLDQFNALQTYVSDAVTGGINLVQHAQQRVERLRQRRVIEGLSGATTGYGLLDEVTHGTQAGEIELYVGRPGVGKSLTLLYGGYKAWLDQGKRITIISPEMNAYEMGMRLDAFHFAQIADADAVRQYVGS